MSSVELQVVGIQHRVTSATRRKIAEHVAKNGGLYCELVREPENTHHDNAIKVVIAEAPFRGLHLGYLMRATADTYAPVIDDGSREFIGPLLYEVDAEEGDGMVRVKVNKPKKSKKSR